MESSTCNALILDPDTKFISLWQGLMIIFAMISTLFAAFYACFSRPDTTATVVIDSVMEVCFALDIVRNFFMQYEDVEEQRIVRNFKLIAIRYLKGDFFVDVLAISRFPLYLIF